MENIYKHLRDMEVELHQHKTRADTKKLQLLIHPEFKEIGYSGKTHDFKSTLKNLPLEKNSGLEIWSQNFCYTEFSSTVIQVTYRSAHLDSNGILSRYAKRSSVWVNESGNWKIIFHQATPTDEFKKSNT